VPNSGVKERANSRIYHQRNFNNWMKSQLIDDFIKRLRQDGCRAPVVLDMCCGKGGDLQKWKIAGIGEIVMTDVAEVALENCRHRYEEMHDRAARDRRRLFQAHFVAADATTDSLRQRLPRDNMRFDLCSCQFALHYSFESEEAARRLLWNATESLRPGGYFIGTVPDANMIMKLLRKDNGVFENDVCRIEYADKEDIKDFSSFQPPLFGAKLNFELVECVNCPEYLAYFPLMRKILEDYNMEMVYQYSFHEATEYYLQKNGSEATELMKRMRALETYPPTPNTSLSASDEEYSHAHVVKGIDGRSLGTLSKSEWEVVSMYLVFAFRKKGI